MPYLKIGSSKHSLITFPSGNIVQVCHQTTTGQTGGSTEQVLDCNCDITIKNAASNLLIITSMQLTQDGALFFATFKFEFKTASTAGRSATIGDYEDIPDSSFGRTFGYDSTEGFQTISLQTKWDHDLAVGTIKNIAVTGLRDTSGLWYNNQAGVGRSTMTIFEILGDLP